MFKIGIRVEIVGENLDDVGRELYASYGGEQGVVFQIDWNHGCGENTDGPDGMNTDPMYYVGFDNGEWGQFFEEELVLA